MDEIRAKKQKELGKSERRMKKIEKARVRKKMWKEWRRRVPEEPGAKLLQGEEMRESPGHSSTPHNAGKIL